MILFLNQSLAIFHLGYFCCLMAHSYIYDGAQSVFFVRTPEVFAIAGANYHHRLHSYGVTFQLWVDLPLLLYLDAIVASFHSHAPALYFLWGWDLNINHPEPGDRKSSVLE